MNTCEHPRTTFHELNLSRVAAEENIGEFYSLARRTVAVARAFRPAARSCAAGARAGAWGPDARLSMH